MASSSTRRVDDVHPRDAAVARASRVQRRIENGLADVGLHARAAAGGVLDPTSVLIDKDQVAVVIQRDDVDRFLELLR